jgi:hypothetical protein
MHVHMRYLDFIVLSYEFSRTNVICDFQVEPISISIEKERVLFSAL